MAGFTTTDDGGWEFSFDSKPEIPDLPAHDPHEQQGPVLPGYLDGPGKWENYSDDIVYELESLLRRWLGVKSATEQWKRDKRGYWRRFTCAMVFEQLYGRRADMDSHGDRTRLRRLPRLLAYYSSKVQKAGSVRGKKVTKTIYTLSMKLYRSRPPYNLKLRLEWLAERGELPCWQNMGLPKDDLKPGHARNPRTDENMRRRRERSRELYNERYGNRAN